MEKYFWIMEPLKLKKSKRYRIEDCENALRRVTYNYITFIMKIFYFI
jgi:hypothetical protein